MPVGSLPTPFKETQSISYNMIVAIHLLMFWVHLLYCCFPIATLSFEYYYPPKLPLYFRWRNRYPWREVSCPRSHSKCEKVLLVDLRWSDSNTHVLNLSARQDPPWEGTGFWYLLTARAFSVWTSQSQVMGFLEYLIVRSPQILHEIIKGIVGIMPF